MRVWVVLAILHAVFDVLPTKDAKEWVVIPQLTQELIGQALRAESEYIFHAHAFVIMQPPQAFSVSHSVTFKPRACWNSQSSWHQ